MTGLFVILAIVLVVVYLNDAWRSLERVRSVAREVCTRAGVQFLDGSVVPAGVRVERSGAGLTLIRHYRFEFATDGNTRHVGVISMRGRRVRVGSMPLPEGGRVLDAEAAAPIGAAPVEPQTGPYTGPYTGPHAGPNADSHPGPNPEDRSR